MNRANYANLLIDSGWNMELAFAASRQIGLTLGQTVSKIASHALTGGVMSFLGGGKFGHGFAAAGITQAFSQFIAGLDRGSRFSIKRITSASVLGGSVSRLTGGKFANGAVTAAFSRAFNDEAHAVAQKGKQYFLTGCSSSSTPAQGGLNSPLVISILSLLVVR